MPPHPLDARIEEIRAQEGRSWGVGDALLAVLVVPLLATVVAGLVDLGLPVPDAVTLLVASVALCGLAVLAGRRAAAQSGGWEAALGLDLPEWRDAWRVVGWTVALALSMVAAVGLLLLLVPPLRDAEPESNVGIVAGQPLWTLLLTAVAAVTIAPVVEELLFRGIALRGFMLRLGFWPAAVVSTAFFAVLHVQRLAAGSVIVVVAIGVLGLGLCVLARRTGRLGPGIGVHALYNAVVFAWAVIALD
ncbi:MAG TPA: CPBP family intramembrane glutamic endopeptidase [Mycobacteriales bacterium]|nr:CPBP family intramembrane glutamic endopeptidase [Mycobacteriales bacterium]